MEYNISDLEKLLNIHNEHEFITLNIQRSQELLDVFNEHYIEYTKIIDFLKKDIKLFSEWEQEFYKEGKCNITYISLDTYDHSSDITKSYANLKKYIEMYTVGTDILIKFYQGLKQIDVTYDIQCYINTLDDEYNELFKPIIEKKLDNQIINNPIAENNTLEESPLLIQIPVIEDTNNPSPVIEDTNNPSPVIEDTNNPSPVIEDTNNPSPVIEDTNNPSPVIEDTNKPSPVIEDTNKPSPVIEDTNKPSPVIEDTNNPSPDNLLDSPVLIGLDKSKKDSGTPEPDDDFNHLLILDEGINNSVTDDFFMKIENIISTIGKIKTSYITLKENRNSINICRGALNTIIEYGLNVDTALTQLDTEDTHINDIITKFGNSLDNINDTIDKTNTDILLEVSKTKFKKQINIK